MFLCLILKFSRPCIVQYHQPLYILKLDLKDSFFFYAKYLKEQPKTSQQEHTCINPYITFIHYFIFIKKGKKNLCSLNLINSVIPSLSCNSCIISDSFRLFTVTRK